MNILQLFKNVSVASQDRRSLEDILAVLQQCGVIRLGQYGDDGMWHCECIMHTAAVGVQFKVGTTFKEPTPLRAAMTCLDLVEKAVNNIKNGG